MAQSSATEEATEVVDMEYVTENDNQLDYNSHRNLPANNNQSSHPFHNQHPPRQQGTSHTPNLPLYYNFDMPPPPATVPTRTESGESQRSQSRRFGQGHAEMQRSAFLSSQTEQDLRGVKKIKAEVAAMDSSGIFQDTQLQKRPRYIGGSKEDDS
ncbi:expressed unknown protein [Seminavis robusta]|uniref:Uncharacterized protein n=1 Tax=Seminavis robusta TaxID=568900 RepID=A0A9N8E8H3_9STRA|nr:expressed unknown protein [Seminavis robusta]|eukprot:Sro664_g183740.1 n/a (155) ;mRNA; r:49668-50132